MNIPTYMDIGILLLILMRCECVFIYIRTYLGISTQECTLYIRTCLTSLLGSKVPEMLVAGKTIDGKVMIIKIRHHPHYPDNLQYIPLHKIPPSLLKVRYHTTTLATSSHIGE